MAKMGLFFFIVFAVECQSDEADRDRDRDKDREAATQHNSTPDVRMCVEDDEALIILWIRDMRGMHLIIIGNATLPTLGQGWTSVERAHTHI